MGITERVKNVSAIHSIRPINPIENYIYKKDQQTKGQARKYDAQDMTFKETLNKVRAQEQEIQNNVPHHVSAPFVYYDSNAKARIFHDDQTFTEEG